MATSVELYEALKGTVGDGAAKMLAESIVQAEQVVTKDYLDAKIEGLRADIRGWMLSFFVPLWIGVYGMLAALVLHLIFK